MGRYTVRQGLGCSGKTEALQDRLKSESSGPFIVYFDAVSQ